MKKLILTTLIALISLTSFASEEVTQIIVLKDKREMQLWKGKELFKTYSVKLSLSYNNPVFRPGPKRREGDMQTPVGYYKISKKRQNTNYPKSLLISYPNWKDRHNAKVLGIPEDEIGGMILIHGNPFRPSPAVRAFAAKLGISEETIDQWARDYFYPFFDWTNGCIAVSDAEMDEIFELIAKDTPINIYP
ncbi:MAG: L,D-transpeptidase family protein [Bdellovibrionota bacterium]|jgi:murein L,D-transpeptidase YafK|nr:L,D-transpeptidase family protein [Bdellovibrionota bacterium]